jgi:hypothetical protein
VTVRRRKGMKHLPRQPQHPKEAKESGKRMRKRTTLAIGARRRKRLSKVKRRKAKAL